MDKLTPAVFSVAPDGEPSTPRSAAIPTAASNHGEVKPVEPSLIDMKGLLPPVIELGVAYYGHDTEANRIAIERDINERRERIQRRLQP